MRDYCKKLWASEFWIIKVASFTISSPDSVGVKIRSKFMNPLDLKGDWKIENS